MATPNYKQIETLLAEKAEFKHGYSMSAEMQGEQYVVFSYSTAIAKYNFNTGEWWINLQKYSVTTSKQQNIIKRVARLDGWTEPVLLV